MPSGPDDALTRAIELAASRLDFIAAVWLFGSIARGEAHAGSDMDLAVLLEHAGEPSARELRGLRGLANELERNAPDRRVDILVLGRAGAVLHHHVIREGLLVLDRSTERRIDFVTRAIIDYLDWEPTHRIGMDAALAGVAARLARSAA